MTDLVTIADTGHVRTITLNRPERKNALSDELAWGVVTAVEEDQKRFLESLDGEPDDILTAIAGTSLGCGQVLPLSTTERIFWGVGCAPSEREKRLDWCPWWEPPHAVPDDTGRYG